MFELDEKHFIGGHCHDLHNPPKPRLTMQEEMMNAEYEMKQTIGRMLEFERRLDEKVDTMLKHISSDNVIFKNTFTEAYNRFLNDVKNEVNIFEGNTNNAWLLFKSTIESQYANLSEDCKTQIRDYYEDVILYIKTNITDALSDILTEMKENGEFDDAYENILLPELKLTRRDFYEVTNSNLAVASSECKANNKVFYVPYGATLTINNTLDLTGLDVAIYGNVVISHKGVGIIVGDRSDSVIKRNIYISRVTHNAYSDGDVSVRVTGLMNGDVTIGRAEHIQLYVNGDTAYSSIAYSNFRIGKCEYLTLCDDASATNSGWINENTFYGVRVMSELSIIGNNYEHNNNVFYKPCVEGAKLTLKKCRRNMFYDVRNETLEISLDENTKENVIYLNFFWDNPFISANGGTTITDNGFSNVITNAILNGLDKYPIYALTASTLKNGSYGVAEKSKFVISDDEETITTQPWAKIINTVIPVDGIQHIVMKSDAWMFRIYATPYDENGNVVTGGLNIPAHTQSGSGEYDSGNHITNAYISITSNRVKKLRLNVSTSSSVKEFTKMCMMAYYKAEDFHKVLDVAERLKCEV